MYKSLLLFCLISFGAAAQDKPLTGFTAEGSQQQQQLEQAFDEQLKAENIGQYIKKLSDKPHHLGSAAGKEYADYMVAQFKSWGYDAKIETFHVLFPTPKERLLEMVAPTKFKAKLKEPVLKEDATSGQQGQLPTYNSFSADGDVTAELVFVNYGIPDDYKELEKMGVDVKGKIVIAKYGGSWRGIKPKVAQEHGAIGCLIYSDPEDDGFYQGDVYPEGAFKPEDGVQRGSVLDMPLYPGDPLTPGTGATKDAKRLDRSEAKNLVKIPVLPISYGDAQPLLEALGGPMAPPNWRGALPITYHVGPGEAKVHLKLSFNWELTPLHNVIARMEGSTYPDEWVIRGNHHDAWVNGANDPVSGMAALMEEARAVGELAKQGMRPKRTLIYCGWDGEEPGLLGSTEWAELHADELQQKTVAYVNTDSNSRGFLYASGSHTLEALVNAVAKDVTDPQTKISVLERRKAAEAVNAPSVEKRKKILSENDIKISALGSGSDYTPFIQHLGIPSLNLGFGGESSGGEYHSIYDSYDHYSRFKDPGFPYGVVLAKVAGHTVLRLANATVLPFDFDGFYTTVKGYMEEVMEMTDKMREATQIENQMIEQKQFTYAADPKESYEAPKPEKPVPFLSFADLQNAVASLEQAVSHYDSVKTVKTDDPEQVNEALYQAEQSLLLSKGLPRRPWFRHSIYAPGFYTGYGVKTLPGIREAIEQRDWEEARQQIGLAAQAIQQYADHITETGGLFETQAGGE